MSLFLALCESVLGFLTTLRSPVACLTWKDDSTFLSMLNEANVGRGMRDGGALVGLKVGGDVGRKVGRTETGWPDDGLGVSGCLLDR